MSPKSRPRVPKAALQACKQQERNEQAQSIVLDAIKSSKANDERASLSLALARLQVSWDVLEDRKRELKGRPKAGSRTYKSETGALMPRRAARIAGIDTCNVLSLPPVQDAEVVQESPVNQSTKP